MNSELLGKAQDDILSWPGVGRERMDGGSGRGGFRVPPATVFRYGRKHLGHIHDTGVADVTVPKEVQRRLISEGRARPHPAGFDGVVSLRIRTPEDVPRAIGLFRTSYDLMVEAAGRRGSPASEPAGQGKAPPPAA